MDDITLKQFLFTQPNGEVSVPSDKDYLRLATACCTLGITVR